MGTAAEFLELTPEESAYVEPKMALRTRLKGLRMQKRLWRVELAQRLGSSLSRVRKIEAADSSVSLDPLVRSLSAIGATRRGLANVIGSPVPRVAA